MNYTYLHYQIGLTLLKGIGPKRAKLLLEKFDSLEQLFETSDYEFMEISGLSKTMIAQINRDKALKESNKIIAENKVLGAKTVTWNDESYPRRLRQCEDAPLVLYKKGEATPLCSVFLSINCTFTEGDPPFVNLRLLVLCVVFQFALRAVCSLCSV